jgi:hypothetical protein
MVFATLPSWLQGFYGFRNIPIPVARFLWFGLKNDGVPQAPFFPQSTTPLPSQPNRILSVIYFKGLLFLSNFWKKTPAQNFFHK